MITRNIKSIGLELEGGINKDDLLSFMKYINSSNLKKFFSQGVDGSVCVDGKDFSAIELKFYHYKFETIKNVLKFLFENCNFVQNETCGNHVHFLFKDMNKAVSIFSLRSVQHEFFGEYVKFCDKMEKKLHTQKYFRRIENDYCRAIYRKKFVLLQLRSPSKCARYTAINLNAFNVHGTIEVRILPYFSGYKEALESLQWLIKTIDGLYSTKKTYKVTESFEIKDWVLRDEFTIEIDKIVV